MRPDSHNPGHRAFLNAICLQAMTDYWILYRMGAVRELEITGTFKVRADGNEVYQNLVPLDIPELLEFLVGGGMSRLMKLMGHHAPPYVIRDRILHLERTGEWRGMFGKGVHLCKRELDKDGRRTNKSAPLAKPSTASGKTSG